MSVPFESRVRAARVALALAALSTASAVHAQPAPRIIYVDATAPAGGNGELWGSALREVQDALFIASFRPDRTVPVQIKIAQGVYTPAAGGANRNATFVLNSGVSLLGGFAGVLGINPGENDPTRFVTVLSGDLAHNDALAPSTRTDNSLLVLQINHHPGVVDGLTIRGGLRAVQRTGIGPAQVTRSAITDNIFADGFGSFGPALVSLTDATLVDCTIADNYGVNAQTLVAVNCAFVRCRLVGNHYQTTSSGTNDYPIFSITSPCVFDSCLISANFSTGYSLGCGTFVDTVQFYNTAIVDNVAAAAPALKSYTSAFSLFNCILARNIATTGSPYQVQGSGSFDTCLLEHGMADLAASGGPIAVNRLVVGDPQFVNAAGPDGNAATWRDNDYRLLSTSPCIDHGTTFPLLYFSPHSDLRGAIPIDAPGIPNTGVGPIPYLDLGCYEFIPAAPCPADFNHSGSLNTQDLFDFLNAWFAGCP